MSRTSKDRKSRLREFHDCDQEMRERERNGDEAGAREAAVRRFRAMRGKDQRDTDYKAAQEVLIERDVIERNQKIKELHLKLKMEEWKPVKE